MLPSTNNLPGKGKTIYMRNGKGRIYGDLKDISPFSMYKLYLDPDSDKQTIKKIMIFIKHLKS